MYVEKRGNAAPKRERRKVLAAMAEAALLKGGFNVSLIWGLCCIRGLERGRREGEGERL